MPGYLELMTYYLKDALKLWTKDEASKCVKTYCLPEETFGAHIEINTNETDTLLYHSI